MGGNEVRRNSRRGVRLGLCLAVVAVLGTVGLATASGASVPTADEASPARPSSWATSIRRPVWRRRSPRTGSRRFRRASTRENAKGGVNGRKIEVIVARTTTSSGGEPHRGPGPGGEPARVRGGQPVAVRVPVVPVLARQQRADDRRTASTAPTTSRRATRTSCLGRQRQPFGDVIYDTPARDHEAAGRQEGRRRSAYGAASSSVASAKAFMNYAVPERRASIPCTPTRRSTSAARTSVRRVLGIKNAGADGVYLPMAAATNIAVAQGLAAERREHEGGAHGAPATARTSSTPRPRKSLPDSTSSSAGGKPVELQGRGDQEVPGRPEEVRRRHGRARLRHVHRLHPGRLRHHGMQKAGKDPTRQGFVDGGTSIGKYDQAGLGVSAGRRQPRRPRQVPTTACGWSCKLKDGKFVPFPKSGKPVTGKLVGSPERPGCQQGGRRGHRRPPPRPRRRDAPAP